MVLLAYEWDRSSHAYKLNIRICVVDQKISQVQVSVSSVNGDGGHSFVYSSVNVLVIIKQSLFLKTQIYFHLSPCPFDINITKLWKGPLFITKLSLILGRWRIVTKLLNKYPFLKLQNIERLILLTHIIAKKPSIDLIKLITKNWEKSKSHEKYPSKTFRFKI